MKYTEELKQGLQTAFIDRNINSNLAYQPEFVSNDYKQGKKVSASIEQELKQCDEFCISVAFITESGITPFLQTLLELEEKNIPGRILTTDYLMFSKPKALEILSSFKNIELKMYCTDTRDDGFHTKGYIFEKDEIYRIIIGSSNMTSNAITRNKEWNTKIIGTKEGAIIKNILDEFENLWKDEHTKSFDEFFDLYQTKYNIISEQRRIAKQSPIIDFEQYTLKPNKMQTAFIDNLKKIYNNGAEKGLLISATGTGKTYASAFAMRELGFKRVLFLVHRSQIAKQALKSFQKVFEKSVTMGLVSSKYQDYEKDYVFATIQTISKEENLKRYIPEHFDAIIYDEAHHTSAESYKRTMEYFNPKFSLGMTATPDKRDDNIEGRNIYDIFEHQIAYEIRLQQAMEEDLLCPFHYFGITDLEMVKDCEKTKEEKLENFRYLTCDERVKYVMEKAKFFGYSGDRVKGIIFCSRLEEARALSIKFNEHGWRTVVLSGEDSESTRANAIERLVMDEKTTNEEVDTEINEGPLDYILSGNSSAGGWCNYP